ncbi:MAG: hypothetical protein KQI81_01965 [Deltaproteobacteria bacterium]|nr:hypothetical protein [Deltaproteobacteria bacterium]
MPVTSIGKYDAVSKTGEEVCMLLLIGTTLLCLATIWLTVLLIGGRNPNPPWWANDLLLGDIQVPLVMLLAVLGFWFLTRFPGSHAPGVAFSVIEILAAVGVAAATGLIIRQMNVGRRLKQFAEMEADDQPEENTPAESTQMIYLHRKLPWQVRLYLADNMGYDLGWIRTLRCVVREMGDQPGFLRFLAFRPDQARERGITIAGYDALEAHPELVIFNGMFSANGQQVSVDSTAPRRAA